MRVAITGAYGFIGEHVARAFLAAGHSVRAFGRRVDFGRSRLPEADWRGCDFNLDHDANAWAERLQDVDVVVNCVGVLQSTRHDNAYGVHGAGTIALFKGAEAAGVTRIIHLSALGAEPEVATDYSQSKLEADTCLEGMDVDWVILKPSLVHARDVYGGTALLRSLAGLPGIVPLLNGGTNQFQPIAMEDLCLGILHLAEAPGQIRETIEVTGPEPLTVRDIVQKYRRWLGLKPAVILPIPILLAWPVLKAGDLINWFGRRSAFSTVSVAQMAKPNVADPAPFTKRSGIAPASMDTILAQHPSTLGDRYHARLALPLALLKLVLVFFWIATGVITLTSTSAASQALAEMIAGWTPAFVDGQGLTGAFGVMDIALGLWLLIARDARQPLLAQIALSCGYLLTFSWIAPALWADPLGPILKVVPILAASAVLLTTPEDR